MILLTLEELIHVAERTLGGPPPIRDIGLVESAVARPSASAFGADVYPTLETRAAALVHSVVRNHALVDGNKRLGLATLLVVLGINGRRLRWSNDEAYDFIIAMADGTQDDVESIAKQIARGIEDA